MSRFILSIVVPTYNRAELLGCLLHSIARDFAVWPNDLELIVIDNASTDGTCLLVESRIELGVPVKYLRNEKNIGMDGNLAACFDAASGKYLWQIGDDEILYEGACRYILEFCRAHEFGVLHLHSVGFAKGGQELQLAMRIPDSVTLDLLDSKGLLRRANIYLTFISANVVNRHAVQSSLPSFNSKSEMNTHLPQLAWIFGGLKAFNHHYHIRTPLFGALGGNTSGYKLIEVFGTNLLGITERQLGEKIPHARRIMSNAVLSRLLPGEFMAQLDNRLWHNSFEKENIRLALDQVFGKSFCLRFLVLPLLTGSKLKRKFSFFLVRLFNRLNHELGYVFL